MAQQVKSDVAKALTATDMQKFQDNRAAFKSFLDNQDVEAQLQNLVSSNFGF